MPTPGSAPLTAAPRAATRAARSTGPSPDRHGRTLRLVVPVLVGWTTLWAAGRAVDVAVVERPWQLAVVAVAVLLTCLVGVVVARLARDERTTAADLVVVATAVATSGLATLGLHGTRWGVSALSADAGFRTEAVTRYAGSARLDDYAYAGLPAYYPPALAWLTGRLADLADVPGWAMMKPVQLVLFALVPLLAYALWRRVLPSWPAALVVAGTTLATADLQKPDEWLVLACLVPWWIEVVRGVRRPDVRAWSPWGHGLVLGLLLLTHTFYFLPLFVATVLGVVLDLVRRERLALRPRTAALVGATGLLVAAPSWVPVAVARLRGAPSDDLQMRYSFAWANVPPFPLPTSVVGALGLVGLAWLAWSLRPGGEERGRRGPAEAVALVLVGAYLTMGLGAVAQELDVPLLTFKTDELVVAIQVAAGVLGLAAWAPRLRVRGRSVATLVAVVVASVGVVEHVHEWVTSDGALAAHTTPYPSGDWPDGRRGTSPTALPTFAQASDPSAERILSTWSALSGEQPDAGTVLVTSKVDLLATSEVHPFLPWKSIYSHPLGRFEERFALLGDVARSAGPAVAADLLRDNAHDRVDGLVLEARGDDALLQVMVDEFPRRTRPVGIVFPMRLFAGPDFAVQREGRFVVVAVR